MHGFHPFKRKSQCGVIEADIHAIMGRGGGCLHRYKLATHPHIVHVYWRGALGIHGHKVLPTMAITLKTNRENKQQTFL